MRSVRKVRLTGTRTREAGDPLGDLQNVDMELVREESQKPPYVAPALKLAAAWSWRGLIVLAAVAVVLWLLSKISMIVLPCLIALLLAALMSPIAEFLVAKKWPRGLAAAVTFVGFILVVLGLLTFTGQQIVVGFPQLANQVGVGVNKINEFLQSNPFGIESSLISNWLDEQLNNGLEWVQNSEGTIATGALGAASSIGNFVTGLLITLFAAFFFIYDGGRIFNWLIRMLPKPAQAKTVAAAVNGWRSLVQYVRVQILVAAIDAAGIGIGAFFLGIPLTFPLTVLVFLASFIPLVGAVLTGVIAVIVALVSKGLISAIIMAVVVVAVQQIEGNVLQPFLMGKAVSVHPLAVVLAVTGGGVLFGIPGALFSVPLIAVLNTVVLTLAGDEAYSLKAAQAMKEIRTDENTETVTQAKEDATTLIEERTRGAEVPAGFKDEGQRGETDD